MTTPSIRFFDGIFENVENVSLRRHRSTGDRIVQLTFRQLNCLERFRTFTSNFSQALLLNDEEGEIRVEPSGLKFVWGGPEGDDFERLECQFTVNRDDHWERFMRFMNRYAEANGMAFGQTS